MQQIASETHAALKVTVAVGGRRFRFGQRRAGAQSGGTAGAGARGSNSSGRGITPPIPETRRLARASRFVHVCFP